MDPNSPLQLARADIAYLLGVNLCRVKRSMAMLALSGMLECGPRSLRVLDWPRLCSLAGYDPRRLELKEEDLEEKITVSVADQTPGLITLAGDPACFV